ncbi:FAD-dependent oxidoreductase [Sedimentibacter sp.]|uniref:FAD-dependent oxidoreductase n=1 Tax=Sedimentibacter sp. TaxID=1960295 RepID=UPI0028B0F24C|nr:FAD-dependent oxidoreductase [Sedimentibacter sp.]
MNKNYIVIILVLCAIGLIACSPQVETSISQTEETYTAKVNGFSGDVEVSLTIKDGKLTSVNAIGEKETPDLGGKALEILPANMLAENSIDVDVMSGATITSNAVLEAARLALSEANITLKKVESVKEVFDFTPGTYTGEAYGKWDKDSKEGFRFGSPNPITPMLATVTVEKDKIVSIDIANISETPGFYEPVLEVMVPDIIKYQTLGVDTVSGCTMTSKGVIQAVEQALVKAGADPYKLYAKAEVSNETEEYKTDVVVIGGGGSGSVAALAAYEAGAEVIVLEKTGKAGGMSVLTTGFIAPESKALKDNGSTVTSKELFDEYTNYNYGTANNLLVKTILDKAGSTADWLIEHGYKVKHSSNGVTLDTGKGQEKIDNLYKNYITKTDSNKLLLQTRADKLIFDENNKIIGVHAIKKDGTEVNVYADAVIIATGGFGGSKEMLKKYTGSDRYWLSGLEASSGDGINLALSAGADLSSELFPHITEFAANADVDFNDYYFKYLNYAGLLQLDSSGHRFMNEEWCITQPLAKGASSIRTVGSFWVVFDQNTYDIIKEQGLSGLFTTEETEFLKTEHNWRSRALDPFGDLMEIEMNRAKEAGAAYSADTLEDLGKKAGFTIDEYLEEMKRYQEFIEKGIDEDFNKNPMFLIPIYKGPFYAVRMEPAIFGTLGGIRVDEKMRVLNEDLKPIEGLYAAGQDAGGMYGYPYYETPGTTQGYAYNSGRIAGEHAAEFIK